MKINQSSTRLTICIFCLIIFTCTNAVWTRADNLTAHLIQQAEQGNAPKQYDLALLYLKGKGVPKDLPKAVFWLHKASELGFANAQYSLALRYLKGEGIAKNNGVAVKWLQAAAEQDIPAAQSSLALRYGLGQGVEKDPEQQIYWLKRAAANGQKESLYKLAVILARDGKEESQLHVANLYYKGIGTPKNNTKAAYWYEKAATQGNAVAQYTFAVLLNNGDGISQDYSKSAFWYEKAAQQGYAPAQLNLGGMYAMGTGVEKDIVKAYAWTYLAARRQNTTAQKNCATASQEMTTEQLDAAKRLAEELQNQITGDTNSQPLGRETTDR